MESPFEKRTVAVAFSLIAMIPLGSVWTNGRCDHELVDTETERLRFSVFPNAVRTVRAGQTVSGATGAHLLDFDDFDLHRGESGAFCLRMDAPDGLIVLVPAIEVIRFYFGTTSNLLMRIVTGRVSSMWKDLRVDNAGNAWIHLADGVDTVSVGEVARIALNDEAREAAALVEKSLTAASASGMRLYPKTRFPFTKPASVRGAGILIEPADGPRRFVVMQIESCDAKYPYETLTFDGGCEPEERRRRRASSGDSAVARSREAAQVLDGEPNNTYSRRGDTRRARVRFLDLVGKRPKSMAEATTSGDSVGGRRGADDTFATGEGKSSGEGNPLDVRIISEDARQAVMFVDVAFFIRESSSPSLCQGDLDTAVAVVRQHAAHAKFILVRPAATSGLAAVVQGEVVERCYYETSDDPSVKRQATRQWLVSNGFEGAASVCFFRGVSDDSSAADPSVFFGDYLALDELSLRQISFQEVGTHFV